MKLLTGYVHTSLRMEHLLAIPPSTRPPKPNALPVSASAPSSRKLPKKQKLSAPHHRSQLPPAEPPLRTPLPIDKQEAMVVDDDDNESSVWTPEELDAISSLFERRMPQKKKRPNVPSKPRPLPLPLPHKTHNPSTQTPTPKHHIRLAARSLIPSRLSVSDQIRKNPDALIGIARDIGALPPDTDVAQVLDGWSRFLRKGSLSMTIRELGHMGLPERALQTLLWAQKHQPHLFPDDRILASAVEVLARNGKLKTEFELDKFLNSASRTVLEAMARGFIRAGSLSRAWNLLLLAKDNNRTLDSSIYVKLILEAGKNPDGHELASELLDELGEREELDLSPQDCTAVMKVCIRLGRFEALKSLFSWFKESGNSPTVVMYTTVIYCHYVSKNYREGMALVWEMEGLESLLDLPAYRVVIRLSAALNDLERAVRYFSRLKEAGFVPTYDIYRDMIKVYAASGRLAKCRKICKEVEMAGLRLDRETVAILQEHERCL
ncbi:pentatricopeptide repeat-containing protein [Iris pallida]|uniref:Pentatricopeptide repeat-containing protein n=1 Tax=Iris pallida TaxID=29817 RepID=A0AAX6HBQ8_IRIPA|nr:pentatricopeptide repeat-containing protein [Iris pallida]